MSLVLAVREKSISVVVALKMLREITRTGNMKTLKFRSNLAEEILRGHKISTWRIFDDKNLRIGDELELLRWESKEKFAQAKITGVREKKLGEITENDFEGHEKFTSQKEMLETYRKYYGEEVSLETVVKIIVFKLI
jgi:hypothetical protein